METDSSSTVSLAAPAPTGNWSFGAQSARLTAKYNVVLAGGRDVPACPEMVLTTVLVADAISASVGRNVALVAPAAVVPEYGTVAVRRVHSPDGRTVQRSCLCRPTVCTHVRATAVLYDWRAVGPTAEELAQHLEGGQRVFFLSPRFNRVAGSLFGGELIFHYDAPGVSYQLARTAVPQHAEPPLYLWGGGVPAARGMWMARVVAATGDMVGVELVHAANRVYPAPRLWDSPAEGSGVFSIPRVAGGPSEAMAATLGTFNGAAVTVFGPIMVYKAGGDAALPVVISRELVSTASMRMLAEPRSADSWRGLVRFVRAELSKQSHLPAEMQPAICLATSLLAFCAMVGPEFYGLSVAHARDGPLWAAHARAIDFRFPWVFTVETVAGGAVSGLVGAACAHAWATANASAVAPAVSHLVLVGGAATTHATVAATAAATAATGGGFLIGAAAFSLVACAAGAVWARFNRDTSSPVETTLFFTPRPSESGPAHQADLRVDTPGVVARVAHRATDFLRNTEVAQRVGTFVGAVPSTPALSIRPAMRCEGIGFSGLAQTYFPSTAEAEHRAISSRLTLDVPVADPDVVMEGFGRWMATSTYARYRRACQTDPPQSSRANFEAWLAARPPDFGKKFREARDAVFARGYLTQADLRASSFVKRESHAKDTDPRAIVTFTAELHSIFGPMIFRAQRNFKLALWPPDLDEPPQILTGEVTAEEFGEWVAYWFEQLGAPCWITSGDGTRFDAHFQRPHLECSVRAAFPGARLSSMERRAAYHLRVVKGRSRNGVKFNAGTVMGSGSDATFFYDTETNGSGQMYAFELDPAARNWALAVNGDDMYLLTAAQPDTERASARIRTFGFDYTYRSSQDLAMHDFCSKIVYPTADGLVAGPVVGRALARAAWHLDWDSNSTETFRSMCIGRYQECAHVPFLREYFARCLELSAGAEEGGRAHRSLRPEVEHAPSPEVWGFLERRYGVTEEDLRRFNLALAAVTRLPAVVDVPVVDTMVRVDAL